MARILIAGCGDVGCALGLRLGEAGHEVFGLRRSRDAIPDGITALGADLARPETLSVVPADVDAVFYTAAATGGSDEAYRVAYVDGPRNLLHHLIERGMPVSRFVFTSSTAVYGHCHGEWVDEDSPTVPTRETARRLVEGERCVLDGPFPAVVVRFGGIYGPGRGSLVRRVREGAPCIAEPPIYTNRIHRDDCAGVLAHLYSLPRPEPVYVAVDSDPAPQCVVMTWLAGQLGVDPPEQLRVPAAESAARSNKRCRNARLLATGYEFLYPSFREGYSAVLATAGEDS